MRRIALYIFLGSIIFIGCQKASPEANLIIAFEGYDKKEGVELIRLANVGKFKRIDSLRILSRQFRVLKSEIFDQLEKDTTEQAVLKRNALKGDYKGTELEDEYQLLESYKINQEGLIGYKYSAEFQVVGQDSVKSNLYLLNEAKSKVLGVLILN